MPQVHSKQAPYWKKEEGESCVEEFLTRTAKLLAAAKITDPGKMRQWACDYADGESRELWESEEWMPSSPADSNHNWAFFCDRVRSLYSGLKQGATKNDLVRLAKDSARNKYMSAKELAAYHREFLVLAKWLKDIGGSGAEYAQGIYIKGLPSLLRRETIKRLEVTEPKHRQGTDYEIKDVRDAAVWCINMPGRGGKESKKHRSKNKYDESSSDSSSDDDRGRRRGDSHKRRHRKRQDTDSESSEESSESDDYRRRSRSRDRRHKYRDESRSRSRGNKKSKRSSKRKNKEAKKAVMPTMDEIRETLKKEWMEDQAKVNKEAAEAERTKQNAQESGTLQMMAGMLAEMKTMSAQNQTRQNDGQGQMYNQSRPYDQQNQQPFQGGGDRSNECYYCGVNGHISANCESMRNAEIDRKISIVNGRPTLPGGIRVVMAMPGRNSKERVEIWWANAAKQQQTPPKQTTQPTQANTYMFQFLGEIEDVADIGDDTEITELVDDEERHNVYSNTLTGAEMAEYEYRGDFDANLRESVVKTRAQREKEQEDLKAKEAKEAKKAPKKKAAAKVTVEEVPEEKAADQVKEAYHPPTARNVGAVPNQKQTGYKLQNPLENPGSVTDVYDRILNSSVTVQVRELLALAPDVRKRIKDSSTTRRIAMPEEQVNSLETLTQYVLENEEIASYLFKADEKETIVVAEVNASLRTLPLKINGVDAEAILDSGCQAICISNKLVQQARLPFDPTEIKRMRSANGAINSTLGVVRDMPIELNGLVIYVQAIVLDNPPWQILMGRPFDVLVKSEVKNFENGGAIVTLHDPNSKKIVSIPTHALGERSRKHEEREVEKLTRSQLLQRAYEQQEMRAFP